jgi:hypothetical protein
MGRCMWSCISEPSATLGHSATEKNRMVPFLHLPVCLCSCAYIHRPHMYAYYACVCVIAWSSCHSCVCIHIHRPLYRIPLTILPCFSQYEQVIAEVSSPSPESQYWPNWESHFSPRCLWFQGNSREWVGALAQLLKVYIDLLQPFSGSSKACFDRCSTS